jgi:WD40 repeat protein
MCPARPLIIRLSISALLLLAVVPGVQAASVFDPVFRFRTLSTEHFLLYFHQGEDRLAARLAVIAEDTWQKLSVPLGRTPPALTHVVLMDQTEFANGSATPLPYDTIVVTAVWPAGWELIGNTDDWLRLAFTHEFTHIVHLDRSEGWARLVRGIFGRLPLAFPNLFLPIWQIEGLATYEESAITATGRLHAGDFRAIVAEAARAGRLEPLGRVNGGLTDWPGGTAAYAYGLGFHAYLADRFGPDRLAILADATARRLQFTASRVFEHVYGRSLGALWEDYEASLLTTAAPGTDDGARRLTHHGFSVAGPRFARPACDTCAADILYSVNTPHEFPALYRLARDGSAPVRVTSRFLGSTVATTRDVVYFDQLELRRNAGLYSDLYALERSTGDVTRLTTEARLRDPDLSPDGKTLVCAQTAPGRRDLVLVSLDSKADLKVRTTDEADLKVRTTSDVVQAFRPARGSRSSPAITTLISEPDTQFNVPRWSPDGRTIAVERHVIGRQSEIVIVDVATRAVRSIASNPRARVVTPAWRPDGHAVIAAADLDEGAFNLYEIAVDVPAIFAASDPVPPPWRPLTHTTGGATWPDVAPDGRTIVYVGYSVDGFDLFEMPYPATAPVEPPVTADLKVRTTTDSGVVQAFRPASADLALASAPAYNPIHTLAPTSWSPIIEGDSHQLRLGLATSGVDVLRYHAYAASATWLATSPLGAPTPNGAAPDWAVFYQYARWRPTALFSASSSTSFFAGPPSDAGVPTIATRRERQVEAGILFPIRRVRASQTAVSSLVRVVDDFTGPDEVSSQNRTAWRGGWALVSSKTYGYSISPQDGVVVGVTAELARQALGSSADASAITVDGRLYVSPFARHHVLAVRFAGGLSSGDPAARRAFHLGGAQPNLNALDFGNQGISLLRGFATDSFAGSHVSLMNADYRWPVARPEWGHGTWPVFLHTVHAAVFADVGHVWTRTLAARDLKSSVGGELSLDVIAGYSFPFYTVFGAAWGHDGSGVVRDGARFYVRLGRAF